MVKMWSRLLRLTQINTLMSMCFQFTARENTQPLLACKTRQPVHGPAKVTDRHGKAGKSVERKTACN